MPHIYGLSSGSDPYVAAAGRVRDVAAKHAADVDEKGRFPEEAVAALAKEGLLGLCVEKVNGGAGQGPRTFCAVAEELATACGSTAMVFVMHVAGAQAIAASKTLGDRADLLGKIGAGKHLTTLALSEKGSRSQFWAPVSKLAEAAGGYVTSAAKSFVTSAPRADSYVSSAQAPNAGSPLESTLYLVRKDAKGVKVDGRWNGLGLRGNDSSPVTIDRLSVPKADLLTAPGAGADAMLQVILPWFAIGTAAMSNGLSRSALAATAAHLQNARFEHSDTGLRDLPTLRARLAEMSVKTEQARALLGYTLGEIEKPSPMTPLYVLQARQCSLTAANDVTDLAMKACGGAAFSKALTLERTFRDARAGWIMAPTVDHLNEFVGRALTGLPLF